MRLCHPEFICLFVRTWNLLRSDPRCSALNLVKASELATSEEKIIRHDGKLVYSSFLPPIPSKAAEQALAAMDTSDCGSFEAMITGCRGFTNGFACELGCFIKKDLSRASVCGIMFRHVSD